MKKTLIAFSLISMLTLTGCMSFNGGELPEITNIPKPQQKPLIEIKTGNFHQKLNGEGVSRGVFSNKSEANRIFNAMISHWRRKGFIKDFDNIGDLKTKPDYTLILNGYRNEDMSWVGSFLTGFTLFILPSSATMEYDLNFVLINNHSKKEYKCSVKNSETNWKEILFLPAFPIFWVGSWNMWVDTAMYVYNDFYKQGAFKEFYKRPYGK